MPTAEEFRLELHRMMLEAIRSGNEFAEINAGDLHRRVGGYPGPNHRMPVCCEVMRTAVAADYGDVIVASPPAGSGATLTIRYHIPRPESVEIE
jgi:hypothetical protein